ncbi:choice-of-anchor E domain-containing protein [Planctomycetota bacterium]|nr:choice-of-anchor E domain-containing protein [Planctomycetota bacterium]
MKAKIVLMAAALTSASIITTTTHAAEVTYNSGYSLSATSGTLDGGVPILLPQFDKSLGELDSAIVTITGSLSAEIEVENNSSFALSLNELLLTGSVRLLGPYTQANSPQITMTSSTAAPLGASDGVAGSGSDYGEFTISTIEQEASEYISGVVVTPRVPGASGLETYIGDGNISLLAHGSGGVAYNGPVYSEGTPDFSLDTIGLKATGIASITYNYTAVPEPASMAMMGLGGLMLLKRRRN